MNLLCCRTSGSRSTNVQLALDSVRRVVVYVTAGSIPLFLATLTSNALPQAEASSVSTTTFGLNITSRVQVPDVNTFIDSCQRGVNNWRPARIKYPTVVQLEVDAPTSYVVVVDTRSSPQLADFEVPATSARSEPVSVKCEVAARLTSFGETVDVDGEDWVMRSFTPTGFIRWTWPINSNDVGSQDLRLEVRSAITSGSGQAILVDDTSAVSSYVTRTQTSAGIVQGFGRWWSDNWPPITTIAAGLAVAFLSVIRFTRRLRRELRGEIDPATSGSSSD